MSLARRPLPVLCLFALAALVALVAPEARAFDCANPPFGKALNDIEGREDFVKFKEADGVAYYNFTGACRLGVHERLAPVIVYGFVNDRLYCKIMKTWDDDLGVIKEVTKKLFKDPVISTEGNWTVLTAFNPQKEMKLKIKFNNATRETKSAVYYEALRPKAKDPKGGPAPENALDK